ncbi:MAG: hypothetical protein JRH01_20080 [Deltaproteobacteria bacterium]|nr:hypothetical protein [Deltaproteobacteria bacterium]MBW2396804.1 hypothetical protein [Deltaproteobacteria bacterium]
MNIQITRKSLVGTLVGLLSATLCTGAFTISLWTVGTPAEAIVGRPMTPVSVAGTARRSVRRTGRRVVRRTAVVAGAAVVTTAAVTTVAVVSVGTRVVALPGGCTTVVTMGVSLHQCGPTYYQPVFQSGSVVYVVVQPPG